ncbi:MAG: prolyl oligopeptidase family serine peptidase [bacterium]
MSRSAAFLLSFLAAAGVAPAPSTASASSAGPAPAAGDAPSEIVVREALAAGGADWYRSASSADPIEAKLVLGEWSPPREGEALAEGASQRWTRVIADSAGWLRSDSLVDGWAYAAVESDADRTMILDGFGYRVVWVNGEWREGNIYGVKDTWEAWEPRFDFSRIPVRLRRGRNDFLFAGSREGAIKARLAPPPRGVFLNVKDVTLPDLVTGEPADAWGAVVVVNARDEEARGLRLEATVGVDAGPTLTSLPVLPPLSVRKVAFRFRAPASARPLLSLRLFGEADRALDEATVMLAARSPSDNRRCTFVSGIDGSVQFYGLLPSRGAPGGGGPAVYLSLHGAGVDAFNQSGSYAAKPGGDVVAPTNRRPFGYNWEDWGRLDALEVLSLASRGHDSTRVYLTGHSMGGHGTWHLGVLCPDRFAAIGPSAGWLDFWSYRPERSVEPRDDVERMLMRCTLPSRTLDLAENLANTGVYVLHGEKDDNVPVEQARRMTARLTELHQDFVYHEEPDAGHWWDKSPDPGVDCVDWAPMFDFFAQHVRTRRNLVRFLTPNPGVSASFQWARVEAQIRPLLVSRIDVGLDLAGRRVTGTTENVARLGIDVSSLEGAGAVKVELDGQTLEATSPSRTLTLERSGGRWSAGAPASPSLKGPARCGPFKDAFRNRMMFVYGTAGTREENAWALAKARFDAEQFWYDGNGSIDVVPDARFDASAEPDRNVVLYGNATTNRAWKALLGGAPVRVSRGEIAVGGRKAQGDDLAVLFLRPRPGSSVACVAAVSGTGLAGMRLLDRRPYLSPGFAYPDLTVFRAGALRTSPIAAVFAGFFGTDWSVDAGEWAGDLAGH